MNPASPATQLHEVTIVNEQTGAAWHAAAAAIESGDIVIRLAARHTQPPDELFSRRGSTFTITAKDGGGRTRRFPHALHVPAPQPGVYIFR